MGNILLSQCIHKIECTKTTPLPIPRALSYARAWLYMSEGKKTTYTSNHKAKKSQKGKLNKKRRHNAWALQDTCIKS